MAKKEPNKKKFNSAVASAILGFIGLSPAAIICGHLALSRIRKDKNKYTLTDRRMACGGLLLGYSGLLIWLYIAFMVFAMIFEWDISFLFPFGLHSQ